MTDTIRKLNLTILVRSYILTELLIALAGIPFAVCAEHFDETAFAVERDLCGLKSVELRIKV